MDHIVAALPHREVPRAADHDPAGFAGYVEIRNQMLNTLLRDTDAMSMAHSLEVRVPLIDHVLVELVMGLPGGLKVQHNGRANKELLVNALGGLLPPEVTSAPKRTFTFPWAEWLYGSLRSEVERTLDRGIGNLDGLLSPVAVSDIWRQFIGGSTSWARPWALYVLARWCLQNSVRFV